MLSGMQKCLDILHDPVLTTCAVIGKRASPAWWVTLEFLRQSRPYGRTGYRSPEPSIEDEWREKTVVRTREVIQQIQRCEGVSARHEQWKGSVRRTGNCGAFSCAGDPAYESSSGQAGKPAWSSQAGRSTAKQWNEDPSSTIDRPGG